MPRVPGPPHRAVAGELRAARETPCPARGWRDRVHGGAGGRGDAPCRRRPLARTRWRTFKKLQEYLRATPGPGPPPSGPRAGIRPLVLPWTSSRTSPAHPPGDPRPWPASGNPRPRARHGPARFRGQSHVRHRAPFAGIPDEFRHILVILDIGDYTGANLVSTVTSSPTALHGGRDDP